VPPTIDEIVRRADRLRPEFEAAVRGIAYEPKGILFSEMLFLRAAADCGGVRRIIESGRARGQSTEVLSAVFPDRPVISIEYDPHSPDVAVAEARLRQYDNVTLEFGDARQAIPRMLRKGDLVLIDGPKRFAAWQLGLELLTTGLPEMVLVHDCEKHLPERELLERRLPEALFSDAPTFVRAHGDLDEPCRDVEGVPRLDPHAPDLATHSYGFVLGCVPQGRTSYGSLPARLWMAQWQDRVRRRLLPRQRAA
jgi:hypothetical protein